METRLLSQTYHSDLREDKNFPSQKRHFDSRDENGRAEIRLGAAVVNV